MADISKINPNDGTVYDIKDTTARNGLTDRPTSFVGTRSEWNALPVATQVKYSLVNLKGEGVYKNTGTGLELIADVGGGTSNYPDLTNKPSINGVTLSGNKTTSDLGIDKTAVGLGNVPNVSTNDQTPTFTQASTRNNITSGDKLSVIMGKIQKFFNDLKTVAFSGSYNDLTNKPSIPTKTSDITNDSNFVSDANYVHTDNNFTASEKTKLAGIASGAEANVQANWSQTNTSADDFIKNKPSLATVATSGSYADLSNKPTIPAAQVNSDWNASSGVAKILNKPSSYTPSSHTHGNIQNGGTLQTTDVAIANGDKLVVTDSSNSAKIARTSVAFDGTTTTQALSKKGTFETFSKFSGSYADLTNKPQVNGVELSGNKTTSDLSINATNVMMSDGVTSVEDEIDRKNKSAVNNIIDIKTYDSNNPYICPCDGYLRVCSLSTSVVAKGYIFSDVSSTTNYLLIQSQGLYASVFVRKGAKIFANEAVHAAHFLKLE